MMIPDVGVVSPFKVNSSLEIVPDRVLDDCHMEGCNCLILFMW
jgi:hypothetical protein